MLKPKNVMRMECVTIPKKQGNCWVMTSNSLLHPEGYIVVACK